MYALHKTTHGPPEPDPAKGFIMGTYEEKKQNRIDRYNDLATKALKSAQNHEKISNDLVSGIPFGQPILVGHHSEKAHRNRLTKSQTHMFKACDDTRKARYYEDKAKAAANNTAISLDDPEAITKLEGKIQKAEKSQTIMKMANKIIKSKPRNERTEEKITSMIKLGLSSSQSEEIFKPDFAGRVGFASYSLTNNNANIKRMKQRLAVLQSNLDKETTTVEHEGFKVVENVEENRIQIIFDNKETYLKLCKNIKLRSEGFKYSKHNNAWQRHLNNQGRYATENVVAKILN